MEDVVVSVFGDYVYELSHGERAGSTAWWTEFTANDFLATRKHVVGTNLAGMTTVETRGGEKQWTQSAIFSAAPAGAGDTVYVGGEDEDSSGGYLAADTLGGGGEEVLAQKPARRWRHDLHGVPNDGVTVADGALIAVARHENDSNRVHVLDPA